MMRRIHWFGILASAAAMLATAGMAWAASAKPPEKHIDPRAEAMLERVCGALGAAKAFTFHAEVTFDQVMESGAKLQFAGAMDFAVQRPGELAINYASDLGAKRLWYDAGSLTILDPPHAMYVAIDAPDTLDGMLDRAAAMHNLHFPLGDLAYSNMCEKVRGQILSAAYVGVGDVMGTEADHLAFAADKVDIQLWVDRAGKPLPRKVVINYRTEPGAPQWAAVISDWKFPDQIPAGAFHPQLPKDAKRIDILKIKEGAP